MVIVLAAAWIGVTAMGTVPVLGATSQPTPIALTPGSADFGDVDVGAEREETITATNPAVEVCANKVDDDGDGTVDEQPPDCVFLGIERAAACCPVTDVEVTISTVDLQGSDSFVEAQDDCEGVALAPGKSCDVRVTFVPTGAGEFAASLEFATSTGTVTAALSGVGVSSDPTTTTSVATTATSSPPTSQTPPTSTTPTSVATTPTPPGSETPPSRPAPISDRAGRGQWWPVAAAVILLVAALLVAPGVRARRGPKWARAHVQAVARARFDGDVVIIRSQAARSSPTCVVRLEPHAERGTQALLEVNR
jgi:hypothetical protein